MSNGISKRQTIKAKTLLNYYLKRVDETNGTVTFETIANELDMTVDNVYQRINAMKRELADQFEIPVMKRHNGPRKTNKSDPAELAALAALYLPRIAPKPVPEVEPATEVVELPEMEVQSEANDFTIEPTNDSESAE